MGAVNTTYTFTATDTITSTKMNNIIDQTTMTGDAVIGTTLEVANGKLKIRSQGITSNEMGSASVIQSAIGSNVAGTGPAFRVYQTTPTFVAQGVFTKLFFAFFDFDTNSNFTSSRFTPSTAGYYLISGCVAFIPGSPSILCAIYKNGVEYSLGSGQPDNLAIRSNICDVIYLNGSTDYVELFGYHLKAGGVSTSGNSQTYFSGCLIRSA